jgi:hypothetical protein
MRNNDFNYKEMDPFGYACPLGSHARRLNPRDTTHYMNRRRMIRRGGRPAAHRGPAHQHLLDVELSPESQRDPAEIYNRFSTIIEMRNVAWPAYQTPEYDAANFLQAIAGTLKLFHRSTLSFQAWSSMAAIARSMAALRVITNENCAPCRTHAATTARLPYAESPRTRSGRWLRRRGRCRSLGRPCARHPARVGAPGPPPRPGSHRSRTRSADRGGQRGQSFAQDCVPAILVCP